MWLQCIDQIAVLEVMSRTSSLATLAQQDLLIGRKTSDKAQVRWQMLPISGQLISPLSCNMSQFNLYLTESWQSC